MTANYNFDRMRLNVAQTQAALQDVRYLRGAFIWSETPQGEDYWQKQLDNGLDMGARSTLATMVALSVTMTIGPFGF